MKKIIFLIIAGVWGCIAVFSGFVVFHYVATNAQFYVGLGDFNYETGKTDIAVKLYQRAIKMDDKCAEAHFSLGYAYFFKKDFNEKALEEFKRAVELKPKDGSYHSRLALAYARGGDEESAEKEHLAAVSLSPKEEVVHLNYGTFLRDSKKDFNKAEAEYKKAIELNPSFAKAYSSLGRLYYDTGKSQEAKESLEKAVVLFQKQGNGQLALKDRRLLQTIESGETPAQNKE